MGRTASFLIAGLLAGAGCMTSDSVRSGTVRADVITRAEILNTGSTNAYDLIRSVRPDWIVRGEDQRGRQVPVVYLDNMHLGGSRSLRQIDLDNVVGIRRLSAAEARRLWGPDHAHPAILVITGPAPE